MVRVKRRYILFELVFDSKDDCTNFDRSINERHITHAVRDSVQQLYGDYGLGVISQSLVLKRFNKQTKIGIFSCYRHSYRYLFNALLLIQDIQKVKCIFRTHHLSGTIRGCLRALERMYKTTNKGTLKKPETPGRPKTPSTD